MRAQVVDEDGGGFGYCEQGVLLDLRVCWEDAFGEPLNHSFRKAEVFDAYSISWCGTVIADGSDGGIALARHGVVFVSVGLSEGHCERRQFG